MRMVAVLDIVMFGKRPGNTRLSVPQGCSGDVVDVHAVTWSATTVRWHVPGGIGQAPPW